MEHGKHLASPWEAGNNNPVQLTIERFACPGKRYTQLALVDQWALTGRSYTLSGISPCIKLP